MKGRLDEGMKCPNDSATLVMSERHGIEIDYCPECRGVWLDRGELDKIIDRAGVAATPAAPVAQPQYREPQYHDRSYGQRPATKKRENWLSELFD
jgi:Zn-finger nucleic acid-binding protein